MRMIRNTLALVIIAGMAYTSVPDLPNVSVGSLKKPDGGNALARTFGSVSIDNRGEISIHSDDVKLPGKGNIPFVITRRYYNDKSFRTVNKLSDTEILDFAEKSWTEDYFKDYAPYPSAFFHTCLPFMAAVNLYIFTTWLVNDVPEMIEDLGKKNRYKVFVKYQQDINDFDELNRNAPRVMGDQWDVVINGFKSLYIMDTCTTAYETVTVTAPQSITLLNPCSGKNETVTVDVSQKTLASSISVQFNCYIQSASGGFIRFSKDINKTTKATFDDFSHRNSLKQENQLDSILVYDQGSKAFTYKTKDGMRYYFTRESFNSGEQQRVLSENYAQITDTTPPDVQIGDQKFKANGAASTTFYWRRGILLLTKIEDKYGNTITINYDGNNKIANAVDSRGKIIQFSYVNDKLQSISYPGVAGNSQSVVYSYNGNQLAAVQNEAGLTAQYSYASKNMGNESYTVLDKITYPNKSFAAFEYGEPFREGIDQKFSALNIYVAPKPTPIVKKYVVYDINPATMAERAAQTTEYDNSYTYTAEYTDKDSVLKKYKLSEWRRLEMLYVGKDKEPNTGHVKTWTTYNDKNQVVTVRKTLNSFAGGYQFQASDYSYDTAAHPFAPNVVSTFIEEGPTRYPFSKQKFSYYGQDKNYEVKTVENYDRDNANPYLIQTSDYLLVNGSYFLVVPIANAVFEYGKTEPTRSNAYVYNAYNNVTDVRTRVDMSSAADKMETMKQIVYNGTKPWLVDTVRTRLDNTRFVATAIGYQDDIFVSSSSVTVNSKTLASGGTYDANTGWLLSTYDVNGGTSSATYDALGRVISIIDNIRNVEDKYQYDDVNNKIIHTLKTNGIFVQSDTSEYNNFGTEIEGSTTYSDNSVRRRKNLIDTLGYVTGVVINPGTSLERKNLFLYDMNGRKIRTDLYTGNYTTSRQWYDCLNSQILTIDENKLGQVTTNFTDFRGRLFRTVVGNKIGTWPAYYTEMDYDVFNNLTERRVLGDDAKVLKEKYAYNNLGNTSKYWQQEDYGKPTPTVETYYLIGGGLDYTINNESGLKTANIYDDAGRVSESRIYKLAGNELIRKNKSTYDEIANGNKGLGKVTQIQDILVSGGIDSIHETKSFVYTLAGDATNVTVFNSEFPNRSIMSVYQYDVLGKIVSNTSRVTDSGIPRDLAKYTYTYNSIGMLVQQRCYKTDTELYYTEDYTYDGEIDRLTERSVKRADGIRVYRVNNSYNANLQLNGFSVYNMSGSKIYSEKYSFDTLGMLVQKNVDPAYTTYTYDKVLNQLVDVRYHDQQYLTYNHDKFQNRTEFKYSYGSMKYIVDSDNPTLLKSVQYNNDATTRIDFAYDGNGNVRSEELFQKNMAIHKKDFTFDVYNQMRQYSFKKYNKDGGADATLNATSFEYNGAGLRIKKVGPKGTVQYIRDNTGGLLAEADANNSIKKQYLGGNAFSLDDIVYFGIRERIGNLILLLDVSSKIVQEFQYDPYGNLEYAKGQLPGNREFTGKLFDDENGLYYFLARYYDPVLGRFLTKDSARQFPSPFIFCGNNPISLIDPDGRYTMGAFQQASTWSWGGTLLTSAINIGPLDYKYPGNYGLPPQRIITGSFEMLGGLGIWVAAGTYSYGTAGIGAVLGGGAAIGYGAVLFGSGIKRILNSDIEVERRDTFNNYFNSDSMLLSYFSTAANAITIGYSGVSLVNGLRSFSAMQSMETELLSIAPKGQNSINLKIGQNWNMSQIVDAKRKVAALNSRSIENTLTQRSSVSAATRYRNAGNDIPPGYDVDHIIDLQLGGADSLENMWLLDSTVNRSFGAQIYHQIKDLPVGSKIGPVKLIQ